MGKENDLRLLIKSGTPLIIIETDEETRAVELFHRVLGDVLRPLFRWSITEGLKRLDIQTSDFGRNSREPEVVLSNISSSTDASIYLLLDFHPYLTDPTNCRRLREVAIAHHQVGHTVVLISPEIKLPAELQAYAARIEMSLPDKPALEMMVREEAFRWSQKNDGQRVKVNRKSLSLLIQNLVGLTLQDAQRLARNAIHNDGAITDNDIEAVMEQKFKLLNRTGVLSYEYELIEFESVAGLSVLKQWILQRKPVFQKGGSDLGLDPPKGVLLLGVQGCGKSLAAKAVASGFGVPLLRLDFGSIYNKYHGETERNLRESLESAEVMAPCVLWIDEIEKGLSVSDSDSGTSKRVLGTLLTWMAEREQPVFMVATANDIQSLPPELMRKGRFDEIFFVDLPKSGVRERIFEIHLERRNQQPDNFDYPLLAKASEGFSGSEIEQAVVSALYTALAAESELTTQMLVDAMAMTKPLSIVMSEQIAALRAWASERTVMAD